MRKVPIKSANQITIKNIQGYVERSVTKFGTGAKIDFLKEYIGKKVIVIVRKD